MATPKLNKIIDSFSERIGDPSSYSGSTLQNGNILTAAQKVSFVNRAMFELIRKYWTAANGDQKVFGEVFPELISAIKTVALATPSAAYEIANPNLDFMKLHSAYRNSTNEFIRVAPKEEFAILKSGVNSRVSATLTKPVVVELARNIVAFPSTMAATSIDIIYIKQPLNPTDGTFLTQNGSYDSPFYDTWNDEIADIAEKFYRTSAQET